MIIPWARLRREPLAEWPRRALDALRELGPPAKARPGPQRPVVWPCPLPNVSAPGGPWRVLGVDRTERRGWFIDPHTGRPLPGDWRQLKGDPKPTWTWLQLRHLAVDALDPSTRDVALHDACDFLAASTVRRGLAWAFAADVAARAVSLALIAAATGATDLTPALADHAAHLAAHPSQGTSLGNHTAIEAGVLVLLARLLHDWPDAPTWRRLGHARLSIALSALVLPDGGPAEASQAYLALTLEAALLADLADPLDDDGASALLRGAEFLASIDGLTGWGDDDDGSLLPGPVTTSVAGAILRRAGRPAPPTWRHDLRASLVGAPDGPTWRRPARTFPHAGIGVLGNGPVRVFASLGAPGLAPFAAHAHHDAGAVWVTLGDRPLVGSLGTGGYADPRRDLQRLPYAHSTIVPPGVWDRRPDGPFAWSGHAPRARFRSTPREDVLTWQRAPWTFERRFRVTSTAVSVEDKVDGRAGVDVDVALWLAPGVAYDRGRLLRDGEPGATLTGNWRVEHVQGVLSPRYGLWQEAVRLTTTVRAPGAVLWRLAARKGPTR